MLGSSAYLDMDLAVALRDDHLEVRVLSSPAGETGEVRASVAEVLALEAQGGDGRAARTPAPPGPRETPGAGPDAARTGAALFEALFHHEVLSRYREATLRATPAGAGLRLVLRFAGGADRLPWELLWDPAQRRFLALNLRRSIVRCTEMPIREAAPAVDGPLRILMVVSSPLGTPALDALTEIRLIAARLRHVMAGAATQVEVLENASLDDIRRALDASDFHVLHYIGHGSRDSDGRSVLDLTAADGSVSSRRADEVAAVLATCPTCGSPSSTAATDPPASTATPSRGPRPPW